MKFKDVAHLYIGCKVEVTSLEDGVKHIDSIEWVSRDSVELKTWGSFHFENDTLASIKLILRLLSDMTVDEKQECDNIMFDEQPFEYVGRLALYLISRRIDIHNLIESGEAIDATTLTPNPYNV